MGSIGKIINGECKEFADDTDVVVISKEAIEQTPITFEESITLANIQPGDTLSVVLGKLSKLYSALETGVLSNIEIENGVTPNKLIVSDSKGKLIPWSEVTLDDLRKLTEVSDTTSAPWLKTWSANEWREAGGNLPTGVTYGHVVRIFGNDEPGIGSKSDTSFQLFAYVNSSKSNLYTAYQSTRGSTTLPWVLSGGGTTRKQLEVNGELIGENNVRMSVYGDLRIINGYIRITVPIKKGDTLVYIDPEDSPPVPQWSTSTHFAKPGEARSGSMNLSILQGATSIYINDDYPVSIGMYNIDFVYTVT